MGSSNTSVTAFLEGAAGDDFIGQPVELPSLPCTFPDTHVLRMHTVLYVLHSYCQPAIIGLGLVFNVGTLLVLVPSKLSTLSSTHYLIASTVVDLLYLATLLVTWLAERGVAVFWIGGFCHLTTCLLQAGSFLSTWYALGLSIDRSLAMCFPRWERTMCSPTRASVVIVALALVALVVFLNISLTVGVVRVGQQYLCMPLQMFMTALTVLRRIDAVVNILLPYSALIILWVVNIVHCCRNQCASSVEACRRQQSVIVNTRSSGASRESVTTLSNGQNGAYFVYIVTLVLLTGPLRVEQCRMAFSELASSPAARRPPSPSALLLKELFKYPYYMRFCLNFFVCLSAHSGFRLALLGAIGRALCRFGQRCCGASRWVNKSKRHMSVSSVSLDDLQEDDQSRVALCGRPTGRESACTAV